MTKQCLTVWTVLSVLLLLGLFQLLPGPCQAWGPPISVDTIEVRGVLIAVDSMRKDESWAHHNPIMN